MRAGCCVEYRDNKIMHLLSVLRDSQYHNSAVIRSHSGDGPAFISIVTSPMMLHYCRETSSQEPATDTNVVLIDNGCRHHAQPPARVHPF